MAFVLAVSCKNFDCRRGKPILLHYPNPRETSEHPTLNSIPLSSVIVACPTCDLVSEHTPSVREVQQEDPDLSRFRTMLVETTCGEGNCAAHIRIHMQLATDKPIETARDAVPGWTFSLTAKCSNGHRLQKKPVGAYSFRWLS
jgi:hypothetical protein